MFGVRFGRRFGGGWVFRWMTPRMHGLQLMDADLRVNGRRVEIGVPEQLLDVTDVRAAFEHVRGASVAQQMTTSFARQPGALKVPRHQTSQSVGMEATAKAGQKEGRPG